MNDEPNPQPPQSRVPQDQHPQNPQAQSPQDNPEKDPEDWVTGDEPMTGPQRSYLQTLAREAGREVDLDTLSKAGASKLIDELQAASGRGTANTT
jgi:Protein of unknown function (DUF3072)